MTSEDNCQHWSKRFESLVERIERLASQRETHLAAIERRVFEYEQALTRAIVELEETRGSFRSRQLRDLRVRMSRVLAENQAR